MSKCRDIQPELSAYVDDALLPSQRAEVDEHVATCSRCQQELAELRTLAAGMAALPKLQPPPRFLAEVRRKIIRGDRPEPMTWHDYLFRPFWLKLPLEAVAVIAVIVLVTRFEEVPPPNEQRLGPYQMANAQNEDSQRDDGIGNKPPAPDTTTKDELVQAPAEQASSTASAGGGGQDAKTPQAESSAPQDSTPSTTAGEAKQTLDGFSGDRSAPSAPPAMLSGDAGLETRRQAVMSPTLRAKGTSPLRASTAATLAQDAGIDPSKLGEVIMVDNKSVDDTRSQAEQLAARCNGTVITGPQSKDFTGQVFFVEVPQEYAATFKLEMSRISHSSSVADLTLLRSESGVLTGVAAASAAPTGVISGVLTGTRNTNALVGGSTAIMPANQIEARKPATVVLEIVVVPPKK
jgi:hypothetical protein